MPLLILSIYNLCNGLWHLKNATFANLYKLAIACQKQAINHETYKHTLKKNIKFQIKKNSHYTSYFFSVIMFYLCNFYRTFSCYKSTMSLSLKHRVLFVKFYYQCNSNKRRALKQYQSLRQLRNGQLLHWVWRKCWRKLKLQLCYTSHLDEKSRMFS